jgi:hypothetical protein
VYSTESLSGRRFGTLALGIVAAWLVVVAFAKPAHAVPAFSRKYQTSCITCHTVFPQLTLAGEAFRRNGYQFPNDDETLVKEEPIPLGVEAYKKLFPNSIWPSTLPSIPPFWLRAKMLAIVNTTPHGEPGSDLHLPEEVAVGATGTYGKDIAGWFELEFNPVEGEAIVERAFVQFSNLFAWDEDTDDDGSHLGNRFAVLPKYALNLRLGHMNTSVLPQIASSHARLPVIPAIPNKQMIGLNGFLLEDQTAIEVNGILQQNWSYAFGIANGGSASGDAAVDDNTFKDQYFRIARRWFGYPMDGNIIGQTSSNGEMTGQTQEGDEDEYEPVGLDWYRAVCFETGVFGWNGRSQIPPLQGFSTEIRNDSFQRLGGDFQFWFFDWRFFGIGYWAHDQFAGLLPNGTDLGHDDFFSGFVEADYQVKPWLVGFLRLEGTHMLRQQRVALEDQGRVVPGVIWVIRQNVKAQMEGYINTLHFNEDLETAQNLNQIIFSLDMSF